MSTFRQFGKRVTRLASFAINKLALSQTYVGRIITGIARSAWPAGSVILRRSPPSAAQRQLVVKAIRVGTRRSAGSALRGGWIGRIFGAAIRSGGLTNARTAILSPWLRGHVANQRAARHKISLSMALAGFALSTRKETSFDGVLQRVRGLFENRTRCGTEEYPTMLDGYDVGCYMGKGCSGAIYEARVRKRTDSRSLDDPGPSTVADHSSTDDSSVISYSNTFADSDYARWLRRKALYPLAIKALFNFEYTTSSDRVLRGMDRERELVPATSRHIEGLLKWSRPIPSPHPNIVELKTAFVDYIRELPLAKEKWPDALGEGLTLYLVMKRYTMTLRQYILLHQYTHRTARLLLGQLLEALAYLASCQIAHRDLKSNNILVEFDHPNEPPKLALADFGSCLATGDMKLPYRGEDVDLGGNYLLRAPEVVFATPGPNSYIDFSKADAWAAGTLAYEIFTRVNPFYLRPDGYLSNVTYNESDLKPLPNEVPSPVRDVIAALLRRNPSERTTAAAAANVVALSLFRMEFLVDFLMQSNVFGNRTDLLRLQYTLSDVVSLYAAETMLGGISVRSEIGDGGKRWKLSKAEEQLRMTFLRRLDANSLVDSLRYFVVG